MRLETQHRKPTRTLIVSNGRRYMLPPLPRRFSASEVATARRYFDIADMPGDATKVDYVNEPEHFVAAMFTLIRRADPKLSIDDSIERAHAITYVEAK